MNVGHHTSRNRAKWATVPVQDLGDVENLDEEYDSCVFRKEVIVSVKVYLASLLNYL